jgi:chaperone modulatory protein CbpM
LIHERIWIFENDMSNRKKFGFAAEILEVDIELSLSQMCQACGAEGEDIVKLVEEGVLQPIGKARNRWSFPGASLERARRALRLQQDLGVNVAGAALALDLIDELDRLRAELKQWKA